MKDVLITMWFGLRLLARMSLVFVALVLLVMGTFGGIFVGVYWLFPSAWGLTIAAVLQFLPWTYIVGREYQ